ncbi:DUF4113 domain-containing protein [Cronobacter turicensis]|nr:DUF4113 domain-containing protein [Cronobacter turicensis]
MKLLNRLNQRYERGAIQFAAQDIELPWQRKRQSSPRLKQFA